MGYFREYVCSEPCGWEYDECGNPMIKVWRGDEEVIRCRDCKGSEDGPWHKCETFVAHGEDANGFCAWAERRKA